MHRSLDVPGLSAAPTGPAAPTSAQESTLRADPSAQHQLLEVQELDARADQLAHRRRTLPEIAQSDALTASRKGVDDAARDARIALDDLVVEQQRIDAEVEQVKARRTRDQQRIDAGQVASPKDLERMQHEMVSLERRIGSLEDDELEVMEQVEEAQRAFDDLTQELEGTDRRLAELGERVSATQAEIDTEAAQVAERREATVDALPADLLALYERVRAAKGGIGAAELRQRQCGGCRLGIDNAELGRIAALPAEEVVRCEECSRILVRTAESGL